MTFDEAEVRINAIVEEYGRNCEAIKEFLFEYNNLYAIEFILRGIDDYDDCLSSEAINSLQ